MADNVEPVTRDNRLGRTGKIARVDALVQPTQPPFLCDTQNSAVCGGIAFPGEEHLGHRDVGFLLDCHQQSSANV
ncbi:hypothetical protein ACFOLJ_10655 [Rugamonas sp. CCM 8940]|uniref:hypothetical protein n=1 Tax=Rugamonas sp. CCM 8940 TaxID=2765359 RepID=UPI00360FCA7D